MQLRTCSPPAQRGHHRCAGFIWHFKPFLLPDGGGELIGKPPLAQNHAFQKHTTGYSPEEAEEPTASLRLQLSFPPDILKRDT